VQTFGKQGYRVLGVAKAEFAGNDFPENQQDFIFDFLGLTVFYDPPKKGIKEVFTHIYDAGIKVKVITGDNADTTRSIAEQAGIANTSGILTGNDVINSSGTELADAAEQTAL
jgi:Ca2+-transporting ATPase